MKFPRAPLHADHDLLRFMCRIVHLLAIAWAAVCFGGVRCFPSSHARFDGGFHVSSRFSAEDGARLPALPLHRRPAVLRMRGGDDNEEEEACDDSSDDDEESMLRWVRDPSVLCPCPTGTCFELSNQTPAGLAQLLQKSWRLPKGSLGKLARGTQSSSNPS